MIRPQTLARWDTGQYQPPTPDEIRALLSEQGWTGAQAGLIVGVDSRTIRRWTGGERSIPYAAWRLLLVEAGLV